MLDEFCPRGETMREMRDICENEDGGKVAPNMGAHGSLLPSPLPQAAVSRPLFGFFLCERCGMMPQTTRQFCPQRC